MRRGDCGQLGDAHLPLVHPPVEDPARHGDEAVDDDQAGHEPDDAGRRRSPGGLGDQRGEQPARDEQEERRGDGDRGRGAVDVLVVVAPRHDRNLLAQVVEAEHDVRDGQGEGVDAEVRRIEETEDDDPRGERQRPQRQLGAEAPAKAGADRRTQAVFGRDGRPSPDLGVVVRGRHVEARSPTRTASSTSRPAGAGVRGPALPDVQAEGVIPVAAELAQQRMAPDPRVHLIARLVDVRAQVVPVRGDQVTAGHERGGDLAGQLVQPARAEEHADVTEHHEVEDVVLGKVVGQGVALDADAVEIAQPRPGELHGVRREVRAAQHVAALGQLLAEHPDRASGLVGGAVPVVGERGEHQRVLPPFVGARRVVPGIGARLVEVGEPGLGHDPRAVVVAHAAPAAAGSELAGDPRHQPVGAEVDHPLQLTARRGPAGRCPTGRSHALQSEAHRPACPSRT